MAYKRELIVNNGQSVNSYKKLIKVSNVCQVLDKSKLPDTQTVNGVTFTVDKVNGTITANGTATAESNYKADIALTNAESHTAGGGTEIPSKLLFLGCPAGGSQTTYGLYNNRISENVIDTGDGGITNTTNAKYVGAYRFNLRITITQGYTANNLVFKPMCINLTEMYGAGHEPSTVAEFRQKFPNDYYEYSPSCWITSYQKNLVTGGSSKNLFNINNLNAYTPDNLPLTTAGVYNGVLITRAGNLQSQAFTSKILKQLCPSIQAGKNYTLSFKSDATNANGQSLRLRTTERYWNNNSSLTLTENDLNSEVSFYANYPEFTVAHTWDIQIEEGSTATSYVPYQYL